jgi:hypothetical protein
MEEPGVTADRLYFSHSYHLDDLRFNEHIWRLLMDQGFHAWIDNGREPPSPPGPGRLGVRRPMDISFNEWMMSQCDGFVAVVPRSRESQYQSLEYRLAVRMGIPRLVARQEGAKFDAGGAALITLPVSWQDFWKSDNLRDIREKVSAFGDTVKEYAGATNALQSTGHWLPRRTGDVLTVALLPPRSNDPAWWSIMHHLQAQYREVHWQVLPPVNFATETELMKERFDVLALDVGPRGTAPELLGYVHAVGPPQIRLCRIDGDHERAALERYLNVKSAAPRRLPFDGDAGDRDASPALPRFLDGTRLDGKMQPVIFWSDPKQAAEGIVATARRINLYSSRRRPEEGGISETIETDESAKKYFAGYWPGVEKGYVFISYAGGGAAKTLASRLAEILKFQSFRCFQYQAKSGATRLESGGDISSGLAIEISQADIIVYLIEENFINSDYCKNELKQGLDLRTEGRAELRLYKLSSFRSNLPLLNGIVVHDPFQNWDDPALEADIVRHVEQSARTIGWALREPDRETLYGWLQHDGFDSPEEIANLLRGWGLPDSELQEIEALSKNDAEAPGKARFLDALLRLPAEDDRKRRRVRRIATLLLLSVSGGDAERSRKVREWIYERRLIQRPLAAALPPEDVVELDAGLVLGDTVELSEANIVNVARKDGQRIGQHFRGVPQMDPARPTALCIETQRQFLEEPVEWARETQDDEPLATRRPVRWRLRKADTRLAALESFIDNALPPAALFLALNNTGINPAEQVNQLRDLVRTQYEALGWPSELVASESCSSPDDVLGALGGRQRQIVHVAGHMGGAGFQVNGQLVEANRLAAALRSSDIRLIVLNGCSGAGISSPVAVDYLTLAERLIRDGAVPEVVAHRTEINEEDALAFAREFHSAFFNAHDGFEPASATLKARKAGSIALRYSPVAISQRAIAGR